MSFEVTIKTPSGMEITETMPWPPPTPKAGCCATCVTPNYCLRENTCAQGNKVVWQNGEGD